MPSPRLARYADVQAVLDTALAAGGGTYSLPDHGKAVHWRQRAYEFRKKFVESTGDDRYEILMFPRLSPTTCDVEIVLRETKGVFTPAARRSTSSTPVDPLEAEAQALMAKLQRGEVI